MLTQSVEQMRLFGKAVRCAAARAEVSDAVAIIYEHLQNAIDLHRPLCVSSGRCCRFEEFGHRLFVTTMELAAFVSGLDRPLSLDGWDGTGCLFQVNKLCSVHSIRPFGCRVFFCDATSAGLQSELYEKLHGELKRLHEELGVPYFYVEWREALRALGAGGKCGRSDGFDSHQSADLVTRR